jgi:hypothetical protein
LERVVAGEVVGGLQVGNTTGSFLTTGGAMDEKESSSSSSSSIQVFVVIVEVAGNNEGRCRPEREETIDENGRE